MDKYTLREVYSKKDEADFIAVNVQLNAHSPHYIRPLDKDIQEVFDQKKNKAFRFGTAVRWILRDTSGRLVGRVAAFVNEKYKNRGDDIPVGGIGFFDCIDDQEAANLLFDTAKTWLTGRGQQAMDGPINFIASGARDRWWGLVVEGFQEPVYAMNYNPSYYKDLFEGYGFKPFFHQVCMGMNLKQPLSEKFHQCHDVIAVNKDFFACHIDKKNLNKWASDFVEVYNAAWAGHGGLKQMELIQALTLFKKMKMVMDERVIWFVYYQQRPIAVFINLPDLNQWLKFLDGKFNLWNKLKFLWIKKTQPCKKLIGLVFGVVPEFQGKGVDAYMIIEAGKIIQSSQVPYVDYEMQWIGDFNPKMISVAKHFGNTFQSRMLTTYRYLFDRTKEFQRHPMLKE